MPVRQPPMGRRGERFPLSMGALEMLVVPILVRAVAVVLLLVLGVSTAPTVHAEGCRFVLGFETMHAILGVAEHDVTAAKGSWDAHKKLGGF